MSKITLIGIDTAKRVFHLVGIDDRSQFVLRKKVSRNKFLATIAQLPQCEVVLEACGASQHWARSIGLLGHRVQLLAPQHVQAYRRGQKNDYRDAEAIVSASLAPNTRFVGVKSVEQQAEQALHRVRSRLLSHRNAAANSLRGLLGEYGLAFSLGHKALREGARRFADTEQAINLGLVVLIDDVLEEMNGLDSRIDYYEKLINQRVRSDHITNRLKTELNGVGPLIASALRVKVADVREYRNGRNFAAYLGFAPAHRGTGDKVKLGKLSRGHDRYLRQLMIHGARAVVSRIGDKTDAQSRWLREIVQRRGFNIACVALAHKNARQAWAILARHRPATN
jgi:transposase